MSNNQLENTAKEYRELQAEIKELEAQAETLKLAMIKVMDEKQADKLQVGAFEIRYTLVESSRLDQKALKSEMPEIAAQFTKVSVSTRFQVA